MSRAASQTTSQLPRSISRAAASRCLDRVSAEIADLADRRNALWQAAGNRPTVTREIREIDGRMDGLWTAYRWLRSAILNGSHTEIRRRARIESELERSSLYASPAGSGHSTTGASCGGRRDRHGGGGL